MTKYIFNNEPISEDFVIEAAELSGMNVEDYIKSKEGLEIEEDSVKENGVVETDASAAPEKNTASISDPGSSDSKDPKKKKTGRYFIGRGSEFTQEGEIKLRGVSDGQFIPVGLPEVEVSATQYKERLQAEQNEAARKLILETANIPELTEEQIEEQKKSLGELKEITPFEESQRISKFEMEARKRRQERLKRVDEGKENLSFLQSLEGTLNNSLLQLSGIDDQFSYLYHYMGTQNFNLTANIYGLEAAEKLMKDSVEGMGRAKARIDRLQSQTLPTQAFYNVGKNNLFTGGVAAIIDGISAVGTSVASTPAGLFTTIATDKIKNYNEIKASELGIDTEQLIKSGQAETVVPLVLGTIEYASEKARIKGIGKYINSLPTTAKKEMFSLFNVFGSNFVQEVFQYGTDELNTNLAKGMSLEEAGEKAGKAMMSKNGLEQGFKGAFGGAGVSVGGKVLTARHSIRTTDEQKKIKNAIAKINNLENSKFKKNITDKELQIINDAQNEIKLDLKNQFDKNNNIVSSLTEEQLDAIETNANFLTESAINIKQIQQSNQFDDESKAIIIKSIEQSRDRAGQEIYKIRSEGEKLISEIKKAKEASKFISDVEFKDFANKAEIDEFLQSQKDIDIKSSEGQGFIIQDSNTGKQTIIINREIAGKEKAFNVGAHELGHAILFKTVMDNPETAINLGNALLNELNKIDVVKVKNSEFKKRMEQYSDKSREVQMEEALTLFSDALATGDIKFEENVFTKIGDVVRRVLQNFGLNVKFNTGRDVYNFIKDYNKSIQKGKLNLAQVKAAKGVEGKLVSDKKDLKDEAIIKESKAASENVQNIYNEKGVDGSFEIIEQFNPIINKLVQRRSEAPNFNKQDLTDAIKYDDRGILGLIRSYDPKSKVPLAAYINKFLPSRMIEASNKILGEEFTLDVTEAKGVTEKEAETTIDQPVIKKIKPSSLLKNKDLAVSKITEGVKDIDPKNLTFKKLKDLSPETTAEIFEVPVNKITNAAANLNKVDLSNAARNINKNADKLLRLLPEGAVVEAASEKLIGTSTGVPKSLLDVFYTKQDRLTKGAGLSPYKLNPATRQEFLEALGIEDGKLKEGLSPRSSEAQRIKSIMSLTGKLITNEIVRSETDLSLETKQDIAAGKSRVMFSKIVEKGIERPLIELESGKITNSVFKNYKQNSIPTIKTKKDIPIVIDYIKKTHISLTP